MKQSKGSLIQEAIGTLLQEIGENINRDGLVETPERFERHIKEALSGYEADPERHLKLFDSPEDKNLIIVSDIALSSLCEHHLLPFFGYIEIGYVPSVKILGLSKFARVTDAFSKRLQTQERLTAEIANFLCKHLDPEVIIVKIKAIHTCMTIRGVLRPESSTETIAILGNREANQHHIDFFLSRKRG